MFDLLPSDEGDALPFADADGAPGARLVRARPGETVFVVAP